MENEFHYECPCSFCGTPLRPREQSPEEWDGKGMRDFYACSCTVATQPDVLARFSLSDACQREANLTRFLISTAQFPKASIFASRVEYFPALVPDTYRDSPLWVVRLPKELEPHLGEMAKEWLMDWTVHSTNLLSARTHLYWKLKAINVHFPIAGFDALFPGQGDKPCILFAFVAGESVVVSLYPLDEDSGASIQARGMSTGGNYDPYKFLTPERLAIATLNAAHEDNPRKPGSSRILEDGTIDYELASFFPGDSIKPD